MLFSAEQEINIKNIRRLWCEAADTATQYDGILVRDGETMSSSQKFFGKGYKSIIQTSVSSVPNLVKSKQNSALEVKSCIGLDLLKIMQLERIDSIILRIRE